MMNSMPDELAPFRDRVLADRQLCDLLCSETEWDSFSDTLLRESKDACCRLSEQDLLPLRERSALLDRSGLLTPPVRPTTEVELLEGWVPLRVSWRGGAPIVCWYRMGNTRFTAPFFTHTALACIQRPFNTLFHQETSIEMVGKYVDRWPGRQPDGIVYHTSRCGSTLVTQMLAALPTVTVLSEPDPVDTLLDYRRHNPEIRDEQAAIWIRWIVEAIARPGPAGQGGLVIKTDSWHILMFDVLRAAFPNTPWIFLHRNPVEVLVSLRRMAGRRAMPGAVDPALLGITLFEACTMTQDRYCAWLLTCICRAALDHLEHGGLPVNYNSLPDAALNLLPEYFGLVITDAERSAMRAVSARDAKQPSIKFSPDGAVKRIEAIDEIRSLAAAWLDPLYERLDEIAAQRTSLQ